MANQPLPRFTQTEAQRQEKIAKVLLHSSGEVKLTSKTTAGGDRRQLRGIPVIGGVGGTMPGTDPARQVCR